MAEEKDTQPGGENEDESGAAGSGEARSARESDSASAEAGSHREGASAGPEGGSSSPGTSSRRLHRSKHDRFVAGVCGGLGEYFRIDPLIFRLGWVVATLAWGIGLIAYVAAWILVPEDASGKSAAPSPRDPDRSRKVGLLVGAALIFLGLCLLFEEMGLRYYLPLSIDFEPHAFEVFFALGIIVVGLWLLLSKDGGRRAPRPGAGATDAEDATAAGTSAGRRRLTRSVRDRKIAGVCGGLAAYFDLDPSLVRVGVVVLTLLTHFLAAILYVAMAIVVPEEPHGAGPGT